MTRRVKINHLNSDRHAYRKASMRVIATTFAVLVVASGILWGIAELRDPTTLPLRSVHIQGEFLNVSEQQLQTQIKSSQLGGFFSTDVDVMTEKLHAMPWVESVRVRRIWPDVLQVTVYEQKAIARWNDNALLNAAGDKFMPAKSTWPEGIPDLYGTEGSAGFVLMRYQNMQKLLQQLGVTITRLQLDERRSWQLQIDDGIILALGRTDSDKRLARFARAYKEFLADNKANIKLIDLRYTNGLAVRWLKSENNNAVKVDMRKRQHVQKS